MKYQLTKDTASLLPGEKRYYSLNNYCKDIFGEKVYRLSLNGGMTCPNRDGTLSTHGCAFCSEGGSGDFASRPTQSISEQLQDAKERIAKKTSCNKFIAYFQAYTNTYAPVSYLRKIFEEAISFPEIVALSIGTRSDCLPEDVLDLLEELNQKKPVWVELGLQTIHDETLLHMNTKTTFRQFEQAVYELHHRGIETITHLILGLPNETPEMMLESVRTVSTLPVSGIKLQLLHVLKHTQLANQYKTNPFPLFTLEEYCELVVDCLELLPPEMVIHRMTGDGPRNLLIAPLWSTDKKRVRNTIHRRLVERDTWQGKYFTPTHNT